jgi:hypothetical protein
MEGEEAEAMVLFNTLAPAFRIVVVVVNIPAFRRKTSKASCDRHDKLGV